MRNTGLEEAQEGIKIARRNISNLRYADGAGELPGWTLELPGAPPTALTLSREASAPGACEHDVSVVSTLTPYMTAQG